jgi:hypothetical protein
MLAYALFPFSWIRLSLSSVIFLFDSIILAYLAIAGHGHYDACIKPAIAGRTQLQNSPSKTVEETANMRNINSQQTDDTIGTPSKSTKTPHLWNHASFHTPYFHRKTNKNFKSNIFWHFICTIKSTSLQIMNVDNLY